MYNVAEDLVEQTLSQSRLGGDGCFLTNLAAEELYQIGESALPTIEQAIRRLMSINASDGTTNHNELLANHPGILNLWMSYYRICDDNELERVVQFLKTIDEPMLATAILAINPAWPDENGQATIPTALKQFINRIAKEASGVAALVARYHVS